MKTIVLAYSGGLDTSVCVKWLAERDYRVICFMANVGQGDPSAAAIRRANAAGAAKVIVRDLRREFVQEYVWPALAAHAVYEGGYLLATALSRPLIAKHLVEVAHAEKARAIGHGCTGKGNDQVRFEVTARILDPLLEIVAPVRMWEFRSRDEEIEYALAHKIPIDVTKRSPYSIDENLWGTSIEAGVLEDPWTAPPADTFRSVRQPTRAAARPQSITVEFTRGVPVALNGRTLDSVRLIEALNALGGSHGIGRSDMIESRVVGIKSREIYEAPAGTILLAAHQDLERLVLDRELLAFKQSLSGPYARLVYGGLWFTPVKQALDAAIRASQRQVSGTVRLTLYRGACHVTGRKSRHSLYKERLATYSAEDDFDQRQADGFLKLYGLPFEGSGAR